MTRMMTRAKGNKTMLGTVQKVDDSTITQLHTDSEGSTWWIMQRGGGSVCLYITVPGSHAHWIVFDSADKSPSPLPTSALVALDEVGQRARAIVNACDALAAVRS